MKILTKGNHIHFNDSINKRSVVKLIEEIENVNKDIAKFKQKFHTNSQIPILLFINSWGGCVASVLGVCNMIETNINPIITIINGESASAGTMLSIVGHRRLIYPMSFAMVHEGSSYIGGDDKDIADDMHNMALLEDKIKIMYMKNTKLTSKDYNTLCIDDKVWDPKTCLKYGLVDKIIYDATKLRDWKWLLNIPDNKKNKINNKKRKCSTQSSNVPNKLSKSMKSRKIK